MGRNFRYKWEYLIEYYLQPADLLQKNINIEIRNDNNKRFSANMIQTFFKENHHHQVFTHLYTPQENGHVESFHSILGTHLKHYNFWPLQGTGTKSSDFSRKVQQCTAARKHCLPLSQ
ncbi:MAG: hypothetical protein ACK5H1_04760 [Tenacibaculum sp.]